MTKKRLPWEYDALADLRSRVEHIGYGPEREKAERELAERYRKAAKRTKRRKSGSPKWGDPRMREIIRVYPQGKTLTRFPTDDAPMSAKEYAAYTASEYWQNFVARYREDERTLRECFVCGHSHYELHHRTYARLGQEQFEDVVPLCGLHHKAVHKAVKAGRPLRVAHLYVKERYKRGELGTRNLTTE